jgi:hypothetical protein
MNGVRQIFMKPDFRKIRAFFCQEDERHELQVQTQKFLYTTNRFYYGFGCAF